MHRPNSTRGRTDDPLNVCRSTCNDAARAERVPEIVNSTLRGLP
ncbi:hypothetical protein AB0O69_02475 [Streptomyces xiamenensis]